MKQSKKRHVPGISVYRRKGAKTWTYQIDLEPDLVTGKRQRQYSGGYESDESAWDAALRAKSSIDEGRHVPPARRKVAAFFEEWLEAHRESFEPTTHAYYVDYFEAWIRPTIGGRELREITVPILNALYRQLLDSGRRKPDNNITMYTHWLERKTAGDEPSPRQLADACATTIHAARTAVARYRRGRIPVAKTSGLAPKTVKNLHRMLHRAFRDAVAWRYIAQNPAEHAIVPRVRKTANKRPVPWTVEELSAWLELALSDRFGALWMLVATTGMRRGELAGARRDLLDLKRRTLTIKPTRPVVSGRAHDSDTTKTPAGTRTVSLDAATAELLAKYVAMLDEERRAFGDRYHDSGRLFCYPDGKVPHPDTITAMFNRLVDQAGAPRIRLHDVRHTYATLSLDNGIDLKIVSDRLGHANVYVTAQIYGHPSTGNDRPAAEKMAALIRPIRPAGDS